MSNKNQKKSISGEDLAKEGKRRKQSKFDSNKLRDLINQGLNANEIMDAFDINHKQVLKHWVLNLSTLDKKFYEIPGLYDLRMRQAYVNSQGQIRFHMKNIHWNKMQLRPEDEFTVEVTETQIILTRKKFNAQDSQDNPNNIIIDDEDTKE